MSNLGVRNIAGYNAKITEVINSGETLVRRASVGFNHETGDQIYESVPMSMEKLPYIVLIVDEMADLMITAGKEVEASIQRLAQMARAAGIHIIMATQRPSVDVITGVIKANFPSRISFKVTSKIDSRTILGEQGAEQLLGQGDMLYMGNASKITRVHGPFVDDKEVEAVAKFLRSTGKPDYVSEVISYQDQDDLELEMPKVSDSGEDASVYKQAIQIVREERKVSISYIQRRLRIGYNRAADIVDKMEKTGMVSPPNSTGKREVLIPE
jgi:S-DNA-T family DNA segregation ATPase FtsK/SpoIIIE